MTNKLQDNAVMKTDKRFKNLINEQTLLRNIYAHILIHKL